MNQLLMIQKMHDMMTNNNNNHLNYNRGMQYTNETDAMKNLDSEQLDTYIKKMKDKIYHQMNMTTFDPLLLQSLDSKQLDNLIKKISLDLSGLNSIVNENLKKDNVINKNSNYENDNIINNIDELELFTPSKNLNISNNMVVVEDIPRKINNIIITDDNDKTIFPTFNSNNANNSQQQTINIQHDDNSHKSKFTDVLIKSNAWDEPENYSDYMIDFEDYQFKNIVSFQILTMKIPKTSNVITNNNNISFTIDDDENSFTINGGSYNTFTLIEAIQKILPKMFNISIDNNGKVVLRNEMNKQFDISNNDKSVLKQLGFTKPSYVGKKTYIAEEVPIIDKNTKIYLFIEGIDDDNPIIVFDSNTDLKKLCPINVTFEKPLEHLPEIFIKFKADDDPDSNKFINFHGEPHELLFRIETL